MTRSSRGALKQSLKACQRVGAGRARRTKILKISGFIVAPQDVLILGRGVQISTCFLDIKDSRKNFAAVVAEQVQLRRTVPKSLRYRDFKNVSALGGTVIILYRMDPLSDPLFKQFHLAQDDHGEAASDQSVVLGFFREFGPALPTRYSGSRNDGDCGENSLCPGRPDLGFEAWCVDEPRTVRWVGHSGSLKLGAASCRSALASASETVSS